MTFSLFLAFSAFIIALVGTRLLILAFRNNSLLLDRPNARSNHHAPVPRGGGLAVVFAIIIPMLVADIELYMVLSILILASVSLLDDLISLPPWLRLMVQVIAVAIPLAFMPVHFADDIIPSVTQKILIGIVWIWFINLYNFMDGIDGITAAETISIGMTVALVMVFIEQFPSVLASYSMIIGAAACGFWWWNRHPARIFLGDVGSIPLGFITFYLLLLLAQQGHYVAALIIPSYYLLDSGITLFKRILRRQKIWLPHSEHYYQRAARKGWHHNIVVRYVVGLNILLGFLAIYSTLTPQLDWLFLALAGMAVCMVMGFFAHEPKHSFRDMPHE